MVLHRKSKRGQRGTVLMVAIISLVIIVPMAGLAVDVGVLYSMKSHLQATVDGASLAAARALVLGSTTGAQKTSAQQNAVNWFYANLPAGYWSTTNPDMLADDAHVNVYDDANNPNLRHVDVTAAVDVPTYFMHWFGRNSTHIAAKGFASRRDVVAMLVVDRSGSMCLPTGLAFCQKTDTTTNCAAMINAAKEFTGQFAAGRDRIGMISFGDNMYHHSTPSTNFQTLLGYTNSMGNANGELDSIICQGGTNTSQALSIGYNDLYQTNLPGALNLIVLETDGQPNTVTVNFWDGSSAGLSNASNCKDNANHTKSLGGFGSLSSLPAWASGYNMNAIGTGYMSNIPSTQNLIGGIGVNGSTFFLMYNNWTTVKTNHFNEDYTGTFPYETGSAPGCGFAGSHNSTSDLAWIPNSDVYGNAMSTGYKSVTTSGSPAHITITSGNVNNAAFNALDAAGTYARTNANLPAYIFTLGFTSSVDHTILQRLANDPSWIGSPSCTASCQFNSTQLQGKYVYAATAQDLTSAFLTLSSQVLRLSR